MAWLIAILILTGFACGLALLVLLASARVDAIRRAQEEGFPE